MLPGYYKTLSENRHRRGYCQQQVNIFDLLRALKPKLVLSDFTNSVIGWASHCFALHSRELDCEGYRAPTGENITDLITALCKVARIGEECSVHIRCSFQFCPWTIAFIKWLTGVPPLVQEGGKLILDVPSPSVFIDIDSFDGFWEVQVAQRFKDIKQLMWRDEPISDTQLFSGLVEPSTWIKQRVPTHVHFQKCKEQNILWLRQAIFFIIKYLPERVLLDQDFDVATTNLQTVNIDMNGKHRGYAFPDCCTRLSSAQTFLSGTPLLLEEEPDYEKWKKKTKQVCQGCRWCSMGKIDDKQLEGDPEYCTKAFAGELAADILLLCLFPNTDAATRPKASLRPSDLDRSSYGNEASRDMIRIRTIRHMKWLDSDDWGMLVTHGWFDLFNDDFSFLHCSSAGLFQSTLEMLGHKGMPFGEGPNDTIISECHGQAVYPTVFGADRPLQHGYLALEIFTGKLEWSEGRITRAVSHYNRRRFNSTNASNLGYSATFPTFDSDYIASENKTPPPEYEVLPMNYQLEIVNIRFCEPRHHIRPPGLWSVIRGLGKTIFSQPCRHKEERIGNLQAPFKILEPLSVRPNSHYVLDASGHLKGFIPVHGNGRWRLNTIAGTDEGGGYIVFHHKGCLKCAAKLCSDTKARWLVY